MIDRLAVIDAREQVLANHVIERLKREIRIDRRRAVSDQQTIMMDLSRVSCFNNQRRLCAGSLTNEVMMQAGRCQKARNRSVLFINLTI